MEGYHCTVAGQTFVPDNKEMIEQAIKDWLDKGADMVFCTGGMSVDPDDLTPSAIRDTDVKSLLMVRRCFREPCSFCPIIQTADRYWDFQDASCIPK